VLTRYERVTFEKGLLSMSGKPPAAFICPGHPLLDATTDLVIERHRDLLKRGTVLVDEKDNTDTPRALVYLEHSIQDARIDRVGNRRVVSKRLQFVEIYERRGSSPPMGDGGDDPRRSLETRTGGPAPYLDYRPLTDAERQVLDSGDKPRRSLEWVRTDLESKVLEHAALHLVPGHYDEVRERKEELVKKTLAAVKDRLTTEINY